MPRATRSRIASETEVPAKPAQPERGSSLESENNDLNGGKNQVAASRTTRSGVLTRTNGPAISASATDLKALQDARSRRDSAMDRLDNLTSTASDTIDDSVMASDQSVEVGRRADATPQHGTRPQDLSGLDLDDSMFDDMNTTFDIAGPASALRSNDTSTISASQFKRRRAGSFLSRDDGPLRPSSRAGPNTPGISSTFNIGHFKRRAREPSILGTAQKPRPQRPEPEDETDEEAGPVGEDDFAPEAESTPFKNTKRRSGAVEAVDSTEGPSPGMNPRKRKSTDNQDTSQRSSPRTGHDHPRQSIEQGDAVSLPPSHRDGQSRDITPELDPAILAPPMSSSSSEGDEAAWPPLKALAKGRAKRPVAGLRRTPVPSDNGSDMSSPPSLTHSPNYPEPSPPRQTKRKAASGPAKKPTGVTTAHLTGLLARRRQRNARVDDETDSELDTSGLGDNDDELTMHVRTRRRPAAAKTASTNQKAAQTRSTRSRPQNDTDKRLSRTYGKTSDKENEEDAEEQEEDEGDDDSLGPIADGEENTQQLVSRVGEELKNAVRKFQEVDKWSLEYEERMRSSSPQDAR